ncbi:hypothetical protein EB230_15620 [Mesorhizobium sp. NZP2234]|uniref:hypothetical protein n=1 Tax=Mesorhizobium sp. NZP2234 TaxID=2483402 RepID=UPI001552C732|nr:hypothetical protein [Mesorhizobium sp. NZP2234]QKC89678.1 hypothetical protein EB230_15620 [Mesorhizobium sp. NZP2234]
MDNKFRNLDFDPRNLPKEYLEAIGMACTCYAQTEDHIQMAIAGLLGVDMEIGWAVTTHMTLPLRESVLKSLTDIKFDDLSDVEEFDRLLAKVSEAANKRNQIVHHMWCIDEDTKEVFQVRAQARARVNVDVMPVSLEAIRADAGFIYNAGIELFRFIMTKNLLPTLPSRTRARFDKRKAIKDKRRAK